MKWLTDLFFPLDQPKKILNKDYRICEDDTGQSIEVLTGPYAGLRYRYRWSYVTESEGFATLHFSTEILNRSGFSESDHEFHTTAGDILCSMIETKELGLNDSSRTHYTSSSRLL